MDLLDLPEAAALAQVSVHTLRNYIRSGRLREHPNGKKTRVERADVEALVADRPSSAAAGRTRIFAVCNHKGGVGKTTTTAALGWYFARRGPTLLIDADPQAHLTQVYGLDSDKLEKTLYEVLVKGTPVTEVIAPVPPIPEAQSRLLDIDPGHPLAIIGSNLELADTTLQITGRAWWPTLLQTALKPVLPTYRYILIDCPPSLDALTVNSIAAATDVLVPVDMGAFSLRGTVKLVEIVRHVSEQLSEPPKVHFLACRVEPNQFTEDVLEQLWRHYSGRVLHTVIRKAVDVGRAQMYRQPLPVLFPNNPGSLDYAALTRELLDE